MATKQAASVSSLDSASCTVRSEDGRVSFTLSRAAAGVFVERVQLRKGQGRVVHSAIFTDDSSFDRWCDADPVRFDYPLVHVNLKRHGNALLRPHE